MSNHDKPFIVDKYLPLGSGKTKNNAIKLYAAAHRYV